MLPPFLHLTVDLAEELLTDAATPNFWFGFKEKTFFF